MRPVCGSRLKVEDLLQLLGVGDHARLGTTRCLGEYHLESDPLRERLRLDERPGRRNLTSASPRTPSPGAHRPTTRITTA